MKQLALLLAMLAGCYNHPYEICNGIDDDDNPDTVDGAEDTLLGQDCDGPDSDSCDEGSLVCQDGVLMCNDDTSDNVEECNGKDDDCDNAVDEMFDTNTDPTNCGACGQICENPNGGIACEAGTCAPLCANGAEDCNADPMDGCEVFRDRNPTCDEVAGTDAIPGDSGLSTAMFTGTDEGIYQVTLQEVSTSATSVTGTIELDVPAGLDFDLYVYCDQCGGAVMGSSRNGPGMKETVQFAMPDRSNINDDHTVFIEVKFVSQTACSTAWSLTVTGNNGLAAATCQ